jgi:hypothetical protein
MGRPVQPNATRIVFNEESAEQRSYCSELMITRILFYEDRELRWNWPNDARNKSTIP